MKQSIHEFFLYDRSYQGAVSLYMRYGNSQSLQRQLNLQEKNADLQMILFEELRKLAELPEIVFNHFMASPVQEKPVVPEVPASPLVIPVQDKTKKTAPGKKQTNVSLKQKGSLEKAPSPKK